MKNERRQEVLRPGRGRGKVLRQLSQKTLWRSHETRGGESILVSQDSGGRRKRKNTVVNKETRFSEKRTVEKRVRKKGPRLRELIAPGNVPRYSLRLASEGEAIAIRKRCEDKNQQKNHTKTTQNPKKKKKPHES